MNELHTPADCLIIPWDLFLLGIELLVLFYRLIGDLIDQY